jgi:flagellar protein FlbT
MYLDDDIEKLRRDYFALVTDLVRAAPSTIQIIDEINNEILTGQLYKALRAAKKLIQHEQDILSNAAARDTGLSDSRKEDR